MARRNKSLQILHPEGRSYACRDCPARCCTSSWGIPVTTEECERIVADDEARSRLGPRGIRILRAGVLPMRERGEQLACVFLDDDMLCSLHRRHGHEFIPAPCQAYPFGFTQNETGQPVALLSRYCPSIRDNYGEPVEGVLRAKLAQAGGAPPMSDKMGLKSGRVLPKQQYVRVVQKWQDLLRSFPSPLEGLNRLYDFTDALDEELPRATRPTDAELGKSIEAALARSSQGLEDEPQKLSFSARILVSHLLGGICYPSRVLLAHRLRPVSLWERVRSWGNRLAWFLGLGRVKLLFVERPVRVRQVQKVPAFLGGPLGRVLTDYLLELLDRRQGMVKQTYLTRILVDLALMTVTASRYARASAAGAQRDAVTEADLREGIGIAELLFSHQGDEGQSPVLHTLRLKLMTDREDFRRLLAAER